MECRLFCFLFGISAIAAVAAQADISDSTCAEIPATEVMQGSALLQKKRAPGFFSSLGQIAAPGYETMTLAMVYEKSKDQTNRTCSIAADPYTASLDASGFLAVTSTCCAWKMEAFFIRLLESMGYRVCSKTHLQGLMHWLTCVPSMDFGYVLNIIINGNEHGCKFWAKIDETCPAIEGTKCDNPCTSGADPFTSTLDAAGFLGITSTCCAWKTEVFFTLLLESMDYKICSKPHVQGLVHWLTCVPSMDFEYVLNIILNGNEHGCRFWSLTNETCPAIVGTKCDNPCKPEATTAPTTTMAPTTMETTTMETTTMETTTTVTTTSGLNVTCCLEKSNRIDLSTKWKPHKMTLDARSAFELKRAFPGPSSVDPWDCSAVDGPIQVLTDYHTGAFTNVSQLDVLTGEYELLFQIPTNITQPEMTKFINSAAINPVDGIAYATVPIGDDYYIVRFDEDTFEFVAKLPYSGDITGNYAKNHYFVGAFSWDGTYYIGAEGNLLAIEDVADMRGYDSQTNGYLRNVTTQTASSFSFPGFYADIVIGMGDYDNSGTPSQWIFGLNGNSKLVLGKVPTDPSTATAITYFQLSATNPLPNPGGSAASFGAGWNYQDLIFFSRNNGDGIFEVQNIDMGTLTYTLEYSGPSAPTNKNDGLGCAEVVNPWVCVEGEETITAIGSCPDNSRPVVGLP